MATSMLHKTNHVIYIVAHRSEEDLLVCEETMLSSNTTHHTPQASAVRTQLSFNQSPPSAPWDFNALHLNAADGALGDFTDDRHGVVSPMGGVSMSLASLPAMQHYNSSQQQSNTREAQSSSPAQKQGSLHDLWRPRTVSPPGSSTAAAAVMQMTQTLRQTTLSEIWRPSPTRGGVEAGSMPHDDMLALAEEENILAGTAIHSTAEPEMDGSHMAAANRSEKSTCKLPSLRGQKPCNKQNIANEAADVADVQARARGENEIESDGMKSDENMSESDRTRRGAKRRAERQDGQDQEHDDERPAKLSSQR
jgi:hypothetical protein